MKTFTGRVAFVTGGASGIGLGMVQNFLKVGMKAAVVDFSPENLADARQQLGRSDSVRFLQVDVGDREQVRSAAREVTASWMDPVEVGAAVVQGIRDNAAYILTHEEFRDEVRELYGMLDAAFPRNQQVPPGRAAFEDQRREVLQRLRSLPVKD